MSNISNTSVADDTQSSSQAQTVKGIEDFLLYSNGELAYYLRQRGQPYLGTHGSLVASALVAYEQKLLVVTTIDKLKEELEIEYQSILRVNSLDVDPFSIVDWKEDLKEWACSNLGKVFFLFSIKEHFRQII